VRVTIKHAETLLERRFLTYRNALLAAALAAAVLLIGTYALTARTLPARRVTPLDSVTIATTVRYAGACPILVAQEKGFFENEGLNARIQPESSGKASLDAFMQGRADLGTTGDIPVMFAAMSGQAVVVVATIFETEKDEGIVGRRDRGIASPADLEGKRIGVTLGTSGQFLLDAFLNRQKVRVSEVTLVNLQPDQLSAALLNGEVDAVASWEPILGTLVTQQGGNGAIFYGDGVYDAVFNLAGSRGYVSSHPEIIKKVLRAAVRGAQFCKDVPDSASSIVARAMSADMGALKAAWPSYRFDVILDQALILALEDESRWAIRNKLTARADMPNYLNHVYFDALDSVKPSAVTIIH
jgi:NitT/TauT family transport system substrate-binding protein